MPGLTLGILLSPPAYAEPKDEIAAIAKEWAAAFSEHDVDRILKLYTRDALLWGTNGITLRTTPEEVRGFFESAFKIPNISVTFDSQTIRVFGNNVAVVAGAYTFTARPSDRPSQDSRARYSFTLIKDGGRWLIIDHNSSLMPGPRGPSQRTQAPHLRGRALEFTANITRPLQPH
ncbi:MAG: SgcJ/EcaC family oxidoreductase [Rhizomicrobium sp.]